MRVKEHRLEDEEGARVLSTNANAAAKKPRVEATMRSRQQQQQQQQQRDGGGEEEEEDNAAAAWSMLPADLAERIASCLLADDVTEYIRFRAVCRPWRCAAVDPKGLLSGCFRPRNWIMLSDGVGDSERNLRRPRCFFHISRGRSLWLDLYATLRGHYIAAVCDGLLLLQDRATSVVRLLHPFTASVIDLPPLATLLPKLPEKRPRTLMVTNAGVLSDGKDGYDGGRPTVVLYFVGIYRLAFAKPGDRRWEFIGQPVFFSGTLLFRGKFYGTTHQRKIMVCEPRPRSPPQLTTLVTWEERTRVHCSLLVEAAGEMLVVTVFDSIGGSRGCMGLGFFEVLKVDVSGRTLVPMRSIGCHALFMSLSRQLSISSEHFPSIKANSIYFLMSSGKIPAIIYHVEDSTIEPHVRLTFPQKGLDYIRPFNRPFSLADYILCYCNHLDWCDGFMYSEFCPHSHARSRHKVTVPIISLPC